MALVDMKNSPAQQVKSMVMTTEPDEYPWGLRLSVDGEQFKKLGIKTPPEVGSTMTLTARVTVKSVSSRQCEADEEPTHDMNLQITAMSLDHKKAPGARLYDQD